MTLSKTCKFTPYPLSHIPAPSVQPSLVVINKTPIHVFLAIKSVKEDIILKTFNSLIPFQDTPQ